MEEFQNPLWPRDRNKVPSTTASDGGAERTAVVVMTLGDLCKFVVIVRRWHIWYPRHHNWSGSS